jgi:transketolase
MRAAFVSSLVELADADDRVVLLTGDLGFTVLEPFAERFPGRFFNAGVAEQNMIGVATGLAEAGYTPYVYSIATFASMRGYEFIRDGPVLHDLPVRIVGVGGGMDYGHNGMTHYAVEDVALMRTQPSLAVVAPADPGQTQAALVAVQALPGPAYLRLGKDATPVPRLNGAFRLGHIEVLRSGRDISIVALGPMVTTALQAADMLSKESLSVGVALVSSFNPSPVEDLAEFLGGSRLAISVEAHYRNGGLGSHVAEVIAESGLECRLVRSGLDAVPAGVTGSSAFMFEQFGLSPHQIAETGRQALARA